MTQERDPRNEAEEILRALSPPARKCLAALAGTPDQAVTWYNQLADVRAALKIGHEVMEQSAREKMKAAGHPTPESNFTMMAASYALGATTAIECCLSIIEKLHPLLVIKVKATDDPSSPSVNGYTLPSEKIRRLELD